MIKAASLIERVGRYLTDYDATDEAYQHVEWSKKDLLDYFRLAVLMVRAASPDAYTCRKELELSGEVLLDLPDGCDDLLKVLGYVDASGKLYTNIRMIEDEGDVFTSSRPVCSAGRMTPANFTLKLDTTAGDVITLDPPQSSGKLLLACSCTPNMDDPNGDIDMKQKYEPVVFWWMVSMAFGTDIEAAPMRERSDQYWDRGATLLRMLNPKATVPQRRSAA